MNYEKDQCPKCQYCDQKCYKELNDWCKYPESIAEHIDENGHCDAFKPIDANRDFIKSHFITCHI